jgi:hypothetical protein
MLALAASGTQALAQAAKAAEPLRPPTPGKADQPPMLMIVLLSIVLIALVIGATLMPSRRGHQD